MKENYGKHRCHVKKEHLNPNVDLALLLALEDGDANKDLIKNCGADTFRGPTNVRGYHIFFVKKVLKTKKLDILVRR